MHSDQLLPSSPMGKTDWPWCHDVQRLPPVMSDGRQWPKISIVTPSFNQGEYLEKTIRSVLLQGYPNLEYIIIDGGSKDSSVEIIKKYAPWISFWISEPDRGQSHAINKGFNKATGYLLGWLNSDDYFLEGALEKLVLAYLEDPMGVGAVCGQGRKVDNRGRLIYETAISRIDRDSLLRWSYGNNFLQPSCLFTRDALVSVGPIDENFNIAMDLDLWLRISEKFKFITFNACVAVALGHSGAKTTALVHHMYVDFAFVYIKHGRLDCARQLLEDRACKTSEMEKRFKFLKMITGIEMILNFKKFIKKWV